MQALDFISRLRKCLEWAICTVMSFYYYDQNPPGFFFLLQIPAFVTNNPLGFERNNDNDSFPSSKTTQPCFLLPK